VQKLQARYATLRTRLSERAARVAAAAGVDPTREANVLAARFGVSRRKRSASEYADLASYLLTNYPPDVAYFVVVELNEQFEPLLGYTPIGQIMVAMENLGGEAAARWIGCALRNFPRIETAQLAFGVIKSPAMRSLVRADFDSEDMEVAQYVCVGAVVTAAPMSASSVTETAPRTSVEHKSRLSDGIERMSRWLTDAERRGDRLFLHLQVVSSVLLLLFPVLGGVMGGWTGAALGVVAGWLARVWMRHSMGLRGSNPHDGFFIRMKERADGARRGVLEALIERVRQRPFTQRQCAAITQAWDEMRKRLSAATSEEEKRALINALDVEIKRHSYGPDD